MSRAAIRRCVTAAALLLVSACVARPQLGKDEQGRAAVTWQNTFGGRDTGAATNAGTEQALLDDVHTAESTGTNDLTLASALYNLAILRRQQGDLAQAERLYRRALAIREQLQGANHPAVAVVLNNLAAVKVAQDDYAAAQPLLERALDIRQSRLGAEHALTAESLNNLALLYAAQGNDAQAEPLYRRALAILEKQERSTAQLNRVLENYAALLREAGRDIEAQRMEDRARMDRAAIAPPGERPR